MSGLWTILLGNVLPAAGLAMVAFIASRTVRKPALTHFLWVVVLLKLVTPPIVPWSIDVSAETAATIGWVLDEDIGTTMSQRIVAGRIGGSSPPAKSHDPSVFETHSIGTHSARTVLSERVMTSTTLAAPNRGVVAARWLRRHVVSLLSIVWLSGIVVATMLVLRVLRRTRKRFAPGELVIDTGDGHIQQLAASLGIERAPQVRIVEGIVSPLLWGFGPQTQIVFPRTLWEVLEDDARDALLLHELAHYRRGDQWVRLLEVIVGCLYWWNPCVWWARHELTAAEEECCDAWVVRHAGHGPRSYADAILTTLEYLAGDLTGDSPRRGIVTTGANSMPVMRRRLEHIMRKTVAPSLSQPARWTLTLLAALLLPLQPLLHIAQASPSVTINGERPAQELLTSAVEMIDLEQQQAEQTELLMPASPTSALQTSAPLGWWSAATQPAVVATVSDDHRFLIERRPGNRVIMTDRRTTRRHDLSAAEVTCLVFSAEGDRFVTGAATGDVRVWDTATGEPVSMLGSMSDRVTSVDLAVDGSWVVTGSRDGSVMLWETVSGGVKQTWTAHTGPVLCARVVDENTIAVATGHWSDPTSSRLVLLDAQTLEPTVELSTRRLFASIEIDELSGNGLLLTDYSGHVWSWSSQALEMQPRGLVGKADVISSAFSPSHRLAPRL